MDTEKAEKTINARQYELKKLIGARGEKLATEIKSQADVVKKRGGAESRVLGKKIEAENTSKCMIISAQANAESSKEAAEAQLKLADAEKANAQKVQDLRAFNE